MSLKYFDNPSIYYKVDLGVSIASPLYTTIFSKEIIKYSCVDVKVGILMKVERRAREVSQWSEHRP